MDKRSGRTIYHRARWLNCSDRGCNLPNFQHQSQNLEYCAARLTETNLMSTRQDTAVLPHDHCHAFSLVHICRGRGVRSLSLQTGQFADSALASSSSSSSSAALARMRNLPNTYQRGVTVRVSIPHLRLTYMPHHKRDYSEDRRVATHRLHPRLAHELERTAALLLSVAAQEQRRVSVPLPFGYRLLWVRKVTDKRRVAPHQDEMGVAAELAQSQNHDLDGSQPLRSGTWIKGTYEDCCMATPTR
jgi:hypothetical protein